MSRGFNNSIVLTQNSSGVIIIIFSFLYPTKKSLIYNQNFQHSSLSAPSLCTTKYIRQYFTDGILPKPGTICQADSAPFDSVKGGSMEDAQGGHVDTVNEEDTQLLSAIRELSTSQFFKKIYPRFI